MNISTTTPQEETSPQTINAPSPADIEVARVLGGLRSGKKALIETRCTCNTIIKFDG